MGWERDWSGDARWHAHSRYTQSPPSEEMVPIPDISTDGVKKCESVPAGGWGEVAEEIVRQDAQRPESLTVFRIDLDGG